MRCLCRAQTTIVLLAAAGVLAGLGCQPFDAQTKPPAYLDPELDFATRAVDLVSRMTADAKISQLTNAAAAVPRLSVPAYNWWNESLHGVARAGTATVFPQAIALAASFDTPLMHEIAVATADEARAKHHEFVRRGQRGIYQGLTFWSPNINIFRDPRWGRGQETYGEDPYLSARMGVAFVQPRQRRVGLGEPAATARHPPEGLGLRRLRRLRLRRDRRHPQDPQDHGDS